MTMLSPGALAPSFSLQALDGTTCSLADLHGRRILIAFLRNAQCAVCNLWVHDTAKRAPAWRGVEVIAIFESSVERLREQFTTPPPFAVLSDPDGAVHELYGSRNDPARVQLVVRSGLGAEALERAAAAGFPALPEEGANFVRLPAEVLVDENGIVARVHVAESVVDHLPAAEIEAFAL